MGRPISAAMVNPVAFGRYMFRSSRPLNQSSEMIHPIYSGYHTSREINENPQCESVFL